MKKKIKYLYISGYHSEKLEKASYNVYGQSCVHLLEVTCSADDRSKDLNDPGPDIDFRYDAPLQALPTYLRSDWKRVIFEKIEYEDGCQQQFIEDYIVKSFETPEITWNIIDTVTKL